MISKAITHPYLYLIFFVLGLLFPLTANSTQEELRNEKHIQVAMRMIGHEVLKELGDYESRVLPIEKIEGRYKIPFESEFGFDPDELMTITKRVITATQIATDFLVEVEKCETQEVVHSFEMSIHPNPFLTPCSGRVLPDDCYTLFVTLVQPKVNHLPTITLRDEEKPTYSSIFWVLPLIFLIGSLAYFIQRRNTSFPAQQIQTPDPNLIHIGASQFNQKTRILTFTDQQTELSHKEAELLVLLHSNINTTVTREVLLEEIWGDEGDYVGRTLDVFISKLRKKLGGDSSVKITNIRGVGYQLVV